MAEYVRVEHDGSGGSRMVDVALEQQEATIATGVPPVLVSAAVPTSGVVFVDAPEDLRDTAPHPAPRRQFVVVVSGTLECETTDGDVRQFPPGSVVLAADTEGAGHITRVPVPPARFLMIPLTD
jgi:hypothetical protein